jgi:hypothetical protein
MDGEQWVPHGKFKLCLDHWHCTATLQPPGELILVEDIGLPATKGAPWPMERFSTAGLDPGWYREAHENLTWANSHGTLLGAVVRSG